MCIVWISEQRVTSALYVTNIFFLITELERVYCAVHTEFVYNSDKCFELCLRVVIQGISNTERYILLLY